jgi:nucleoside-diphosphate-sugar epimerase
MMNSLALITGGSGYFGSLLTQKLIQRGTPCRVFDLNDAEDRAAEVEFIQGDIRNPAAVQRACRGASVIYHNVAQVPLARSKSLFASVNIEGTRNLLEAAVAAGVRKLIYTSSSAVFGVPESNPVTEQTQPKPAEAYGKAKYEGEQLCRQVAKHGLDVTIIRPRTILGHGRLGIFQILFEWIREGDNVPVLGKGDNLYQFVHADDLAEACIAASGRKGFAIYNCGAAEFGSMRQALEALCRHAATGSQVKSVPMLPAIVAMKVTTALGLSPLGAYHALMYGRSMYFDISKATTEMGWKPRYSNESMFVESYDWYLRHREEVLNSTQGSHHRRAVKQGVLKLAKWIL